MAKPFDLNSKEFPIGVYSADPPTAENFAYLKSIGVNYVHSYGMGHGNVEDEKRTKDFLDLAEKNGLKVMVNLMGRIWVKKTNGADELRKFIRKFKNHPAVGFWYLYDEPKAKNLAALRKLYSMLKQESPLIPVALVTPWIEEWKSFQEVYDILMVDLYPVKDKKFPNSPVNLLTKFTNEAIALGKPVIAVPQMFNWKIYPNQVKGYDIKKLRYPNAIEIRYWNYYTLAAGGRGLFYYSFYHAFKNDPEWVKKVFAKEIKEARRFIELTAPANKPVAFKRAEDDNYKMAIWTRENGEFLVLINNWPLARPKVKRWTENMIVGAELIPWGSTRNVKAKIDNGKLIIDEKINPWEVFVWKVKRIIK